MGEAEVVIVGGHRATLARAGPGADPTRRTPGEQYGRATRAGIRSGPEPKGALVFDTILGLPVHALVVHAEVVLLPLVAAVTVWWSARPAATRRTGLLVIAADAVVTVVTWVAAQSGEALQRRLGGTVARAHGELASALPWMALALTVAAVIVQLTRQDPAQAPAPGPHLPGRVTAPLVGVVAVVAVVWTIRVGHSGATAVWAEIIRNTGK